MKDVGLKEELRRLSEQHGFRALTLVPDLAFVGLIRDAIDSAEAARDVLSGQRPHRAYSMARVCFEAAQRILPLGVTEDYLRLGTRAWVYYQRKAAALVDDGPLLDDSAAQILDTWELYNPAARALVEEAIEELGARRGPDNFLRRNLAEVAAESYEVLASARGNRVPEGAVGVNRAVYSALTLDTHACVRIVPAALRIDGDGFVVVEEQSRSRSEIETAIALALETSLSEAIAAVKYRLEARRRAVASRLEDEVGSGGQRTPDDHLPDLGKLAISQGLAHTQCVFPDVPIHQIRELPDSTLSVSLAHGPPPDQHLATFDFKGAMASALISRVREEFTALPALEVRPFFIDLPVPIPLTLRTELGDLKKTETESFVPFVVIAID